MTKWNCTIVPQWRSVQPFLQEEEEGDTYSHTHSHTRHICLDSDEQSIALSHCIHTAHKKETISIFIQKKWCLNSSKSHVVIKCQTTWVKSHLKHVIELCPVLLERAINYQLGESAVYSLLVCVKIKTHHCQGSGFSTTCSYTARTCNTSTRPKYWPAI